MNGICILVPEENFSDGGFAKSNHCILHYFIFFFFFFFFFFFIIFFFISGGVVDFKGLPLPSF